MSKNDITHEIAYDDEKCQISYHLSMYIGLDPDTRYCNLKQHGLSSELSNFVKHTLC